MRASGLYLALQTRAVGPCDQRTFSPPSPGYLCGAGDVQLDTVIGVTHYPLQVGVPLAEQKHLSLARDEPSPIAPASAIAPPQSTERVDTSFARPPGAGLPAAPHRPCADMVQTKRASRPSAEATGAERRSRSSAEFVVNLGPPEPVASYGSSEGPDGPGAAPAAAAAPMTGAVEGSSPKARPDLMASIEEESQLTLRYSRISAFVSTNLQPPGLVDRLKRAAGTARGEEQPPEEKQVGDFVGSYSGIC